MTTSFKTAIIVAGLLPFTLYANQPTKPSCQYKYKGAMNAKTIVVTADKPTFTIKVPSNRTTGFQWFLGGYTKDLIEPVSSTFVAPKVKMAGAPGYTVWKFEVDDDAFEVPMVMWVKLVHMRPWTTQGATKQIYKVVTQSATMDKD